MTDLEQFVKECEALGRRKDNKRGCGRPKSRPAMSAVNKTKEEIEAINADIIMSSLGPDSLCWKCLNAHDNVKHSCEKFKTDRPIAGSEYKECEGPLGTEYNIRRCPCFKFEYDRPQPLRDIVRILAHWTGVTTATVWRNPQRFLAEYNELCPACALSILAENEEDDEWDIDDTDTDTDTDTER